MSVKMEKRGSCFLSNSSNTAGKIVSFSPVYSSFSQTLILELETTQQKGISSVFWIVELEYKDKTSVDEI